MPNIRVEIEGHDPMEFPEGTDPKVIDMVVKRDVIGKQTPQPPTDNRTTGQKFVGAILPYAEPAIEIGAATVGGLAGGTGGSLSPTAPVTMPAGAIAGTGLGYAFGKRLTGMMRNYAGVDQSKGMLEQVSDTGKDFVVGTGLQAGGAMLDKGVSMVGKKVAQSGLPEWLISKSIKTPTGSRWQKVLPESEFSAREAVVDTMKVEKIPPNKYGRQMVEKRINEMQAQIEQTVQKIPKEKTTRSYDLVGDSLKPVKKDAMWSSQTKEANAAISKIEQNVIDKGLMNPEELHALKQQFYNDINWDRNKPIVDAAGRFTENARKAIAHEAMVRLEAFAPELKTLNKKQAIYLDTQKAIMNTIDRYERLNVGGLQAVILATKNIGLAASEVLMGTPSFKAWLGRNLYHIGTREGLLITQAITGATRGY